MPSKDTKKRASGITPEAFKQLVGRNIKQLRTELKMTQTEFGESIGVAYYVISRYESGEDEISLYLILKLCEVFDTTLERLLKGTCIENPN